MRIVRARVLDARLGLWKRVTGSRVLLWKKLLGRVSRGVREVRGWVTYEAEHLGGGGEV